MKPCTVCGIDVSERDYYGKSREENGVMVEFEWTCDICYDQQVLDTYAATGTLTTRLLLIEAMDREYVFTDFDGTAHVAIEQMQRRRVENRVFTLKNKTILARAIQEIKEVSTVTRAFELLCWLGKIQKFYQDSPARGHSGNGDEYRALLWGCAGRVLLTLNGEGGESITLIYDEDSPTARGGIQGINATREQVMGLLHKAICRFPELKADEEVTIS